MKNTIVMQLGNALGILKDHPGIINVIDLAEAQKFLKSIEKTTIGMVPNFKEINPDQIQALIQEDKTNVDNWINALNTLKGVFAFKDVSPSDDYVICGNVAKDLAALQAVTDDEGMGFSFRTGNRASFGNLGDTTWEQVYFAIIKHVNENLLVPAVPQI